MEDIDCSPFNICLHQRKMDPLVLTCEGKIITTKHPLIHYFLNINAKDTLSG